MKQVSLPAVVGNADVTVEFDTWSEDRSWYIDFDTLDVWYLAPTSTPEERKWCNIVDCLSDKQLEDIEIQARAKHEIVVSQLRELDY